MPRLRRDRERGRGLPQQLDGRRTLKEAAASARLDEFEAAKIACALLFLGLVERVQAGVTASSAAPVTFADVEAESGNELDLGATAAQAFAPEPAMVVPTVEPEPPPADRHRRPTTSRPVRDRRGSAAGRERLRESDEIAFPSFAVRSRSRPAPSVVPARRPTTSLR